jgi:hypothetical protein
MSPQKMRITKQLTRDDVADASTQHVVTKAMGQATGITAAAPSDDRSNLEPLKALDQPVANLRLYRPCRHIMPYLIKSRDVASIGI